MTLPFFKKPDKNSEEENNSIIASSSRLSKLSGLDLTNFDMLRALANDYTSVYYTNLETGESAVVSFDDRNMREVAVVYDENVLQLDDFSRQYANKRVPPSHYQDFVEVVSLANLRVKMAESPVFKYRFIAYKGDKENHFLMKACRINDSKTHIIVGFSDIEAQVAYEKERSIEFESVNNIKGEFLKNTSHELMTPLNAINGFTEIALKEKDPEKVKDYLQHIYSETQGLIVQIRNLISMSEFSLINRPPCYQTYALSDLFNAMKDRMKAPAEAKNITFTTDESGIKVNKILTDI